MSSKKWTKRINYEMVVAGSAVFISVCALVVSIYEAKIMREQQYASAWPYLNHGPKYIYQKGLLYDVENVGLGPALIQDVSIKIGEKEVEGPQALVEELLDISLDTLPIGYFTLEGTVLAPGDKVSLLQVIDLDLAQRFREMEERYQIEICYCSIYEDCWSIRSKRQPEKVESCK